MGTLVLEPVPDRVKRELHGEPILFAVRQKRRISKAGAIGGATLGVIVAIVGILILGTRGDPSVSLDIGGFVLQGGTPTGSAALLAVGAIAVVGGVGMTAISPMLYRMPGDLAVGTPTRLLHVGRWRTHTLTWREVDRVVLDGDGTLEVRRLSNADTQRSFDIVEPPHAADLLVLIEGLLRPARPLSPLAAAVGTGHAPEAERAPRPPALRFRSTRKGVGAGLRIGIPFALLGLAVVLIFGATLLTGGTISASTNDGPMREVGAQDAVAWVPVGVGALFAAVGIGLTWLAWPRRSVTDHEIHDDGLFSRDAWGLTESIEWRLFTGEVHRREGRHGTELRFPLHTRTRAGRGRKQVVVTMIGVENADAVEAEMRRRIA